MSELNPIIIMSFAKIYRINLNHSRKIFLLRLFFVAQIIICWVQFQIKKEKNRSSFININNKNFRFFIQPFFKRMIYTIPKILFHFLSGTYSIGLIYYSLSKEILSLPFFIYGFF